MVSSGASRTATGSGVALLLLCFGVAAGAARGEGSAPYDPVRVFYPLVDCRSAVLEIEIFDRGKQFWEPHPRHPRIFGDSCQTEDAGVLLNETRIRCSDPPRHGRFPAWRVGVDVWSPAWMDRCDAAPGRFSEADRMGIELAAPKPGEVIEDADNLVRVEGSVLFDGRLAGAYDVAIVFDASESLDESRGEAPEERSLLATQARAIRRFLGWLESREDPIRVGLVSFAGANLDSAAPRSRRPDGSLEVPLTDEFDTLDRALEASLAGGFSGAPLFVDALERALALLLDGDEQRAPSASARVLLVLAGGEARLPFGGGAGWEPAFRKRAVDATRRARVEGVSLCTVVVGGEVGPPPEMILDMMGASPGSFTRIEKLGPDAPLRRHCPLPRVAQGEVQNLTNAASALELAVDGQGRFSARLPLRSGENTLVVRALGSDGRRASRRLDVVLDNSLLRVQLLEAERERMRRERERLKLLEIEVEEGAPAPR